jgi:hypothetical protein
LNAPTLKARAPEAVLAKLREVIAKIERGPACEWSRSGGGPTTPEAAHNEANAGQARWRASWIEPELRRILAWAAGANTAHEIAENGLGSTYEKANVHGFKPGDRVRVTAAWAEDAAEAGLHSRHGTRPPETIALLRAGGTVTETSAYSVALVLADGHGTSFSSTHLERIP